MKSIAFISSSAPRPPVITPMAIPPSYSIGPIEYFVTAYIPLDPMSAIFFPSFAD